MKQDMLRPNNCLAGLPWALWKEVEYYKDAPDVPYASMEWVPAFEKVPSAGFSPEPPVRLLSQRSKPKVGGKHKMGAQLSSKTNLDDPGVRLSIRQKKNLKNRRK